MLRLIAILFGIAFIFAGVAGFMPAWMADGRLFGYFEAGFVHNLIHLFSGILAIMAATSFYYTSLYFKVLGIVYMLIALVGFILNGNLGFLMMHVNLADNFLHMSIAIVALFLGFFFDKQP